MTKLPGGGGGLFPLIDRISFQTTLSHNVCRYRKFVTFLWLDNSEKLLKHLRWHGWEWDYRMLYPRLRVYAWLPGYVFHLCLYNYSMQVCLRLVYVYFILFYL